MPLPGRGRGWSRRRLLGEGGFARVWLVDGDSPDGVPVALKELAPDPDPVRQERHEGLLRKEFALLASLKHPGFPEAHRFHDDAGEGMPGFTLEWVEGETLAEAARREGARPFLDLVAEALRTLDFLHAQGILHRDVKPANLLVRRRPRLGCRVVLVDFGLARTVNDGAPEPAVGTPDYLAPEIVEGGMASIRSDLHALGAVARDALRGEGAPAPAPGFDAWLAAVLDEDPARRPARGADALALLDETCGLRHPRELPMERAARIASGVPSEREPEITSLARVIEDGGPRVAFVAGPPGSGKSRLLRHLEADAVARGWHVVPPDTRGAGALEALRVPPAGRPCLVLLDETESADGRLVDAVDKLARDPVSDSLRVAAGLRAATIRNPVLDRLVRDAGFLPSVARIDLRPLDEPRIRALARRALGGQPSDERIRWLTASGGGSAAATESLLIAAAWERREDASVPLRTAAPARLALLSEEALRWIEAFAVWPESPDAASLASLAGLDAASASAAAAEAASAGLVAAGASSWRPESRDLLEGILERMSDERRRELNARASEIAAASPASTDPWVFHRLRLGSGDRAAAAALAADAARDALGRGDPSEAAHRFGRALRLSGRSREHRHALRYGQAEALAAAGLHDAAVRALGSATRWARTPSERHAAEAARAFALAQSGRFERAVAAARRAAAWADAHGDPEIAAAARRAEGIALGRLGREIEALPILEKARDELRRLGRSADEADVLHTLATCKIRLGRDDAEPDLTRALELWKRAPRAGGTGDALKARAALGVLTARRGDRDLGRRILEDARREAAASGHLAVEEAVIARLADIAIDEGRLDAAVRLASEALDLARHLGDANLALSGAARLADARIRCGRSMEAISVLREALDAPLGRVEPQTADYARMLLADAMSEAGAAGDDGCRSLMEGVLARCRERRKPRPRLMALVIELERRVRAGGREAAAPVEAEIDAVASPSAGDVDPEIAFRAALARAEARLAGGEAGAARRFAAEALEVARARGFPAFEARAGAALAAALSADGDDRGAREALDRSRELLARAAARIEEPAVRADFLARPAYAALAAVAREDAGRARVGALYDMIRILNAETDPDALLGEILDLAIRAVSAERGLVLLREDRDGPHAGEFAVRAARDLEPETARDAEAYSRRVVEAAGAGHSILALDAGSDDRFRASASVSLYGIRSLMCVPLRSRGRILGTVYLDSRGEGRRFTRDDLRFVEAFADHAGLAIENARMRARLEWQNRQLQAAAEARTGYASLVGASAPMRAVFSLVEKVASVDLPVLVRGESGTGKELVARAIHFQGPRRRKPFLSENCAALPESLLESELFGHVRGAFTGADRSRPGLFEQAHGGTLFLDEVGDMSAAMQARLLRVLEDGMVRRVGAEKAAPVDVRVVTATHRDLHAEVRSGRFRQDLLYRLQVLTIEIAPLRERPGDVPLLVAHFLERIGRERGRPPVPVADDALALFERYSWPGNVRELQNALQRLSLLAGNRAINARLIESDPVLRESLVPEERERAPSYRLKAGEAGQIRRALDAAGGNRVRAAGMLGISRATLYRKLREFGL